MKVREIHWTMGRYVVVEAPDDQTISRLMLALGALGNIKSETLRAYSAKEMAPVGLTEGKSAAPFDQGSDEALPCLRSFIGAPTRFPG